MADLKGRSKDMKDKVVGEGKEAYGKATDDKSKETEGKAQSLGADIKAFCYFNLMSHDDNTAILFMGDFLEKFDDIL